MRRVYSISAALLLCLIFVATLHAATFQLEDGSTLTGDLISSTEAGVIVRQADGGYSDRVPWENFSQAELRKFARDPKVAPFVTALIEPTPEERAQMADIQLRPVPRLERPQKQSLPGALFSSGVGLLLVFALYAANIYAAHEIAVFRGRPAALVCGVAAVAPVIGPIVFLAMGTKMAPTQEAAESAPAAPADSTLESNPLAVSGQATAASPGGAESSPGLRLADTQPSKSTGAIPEPQIFQRGAFTFNRRFFETRFAGFFGMHRREADKDLTLLIKSSRGQYVAERITRIASADVHVQVQGGGEVMLPFSEIQEVQLKHKDS